MGLMDGITNSFTSMTQGLAFAYKAMFGASSDQRLIDGFRDGTRGAPNHPFITNPYAPPYQNPESLDSYGRETGVMREEYQRFYASEPSLQSAIDGKVAAIASLDVSVLPQDEKSEADKRVAEFVREAVKNCPGGWSGLISNILMPSFVNGFSVTEKWLGGIDSEPCFDRLRPKYAGLWSIRRLAQIDTNYIKFQLDNTKQVIGVINTKLGLIGYSPDRVMIYSHRSIFENPYGRSDIRAAYRSCQLIENAYKLWYIALKNYSAPFMKVKTKATGASFSKLKDALAAARAGGWITLSQDDDADLLNFASATSWQAFERKVIMARQEIYLAIRGSYLPFLEGGEQDARGDTQVHKVSSDAIESLIVNSVCEVINHQLVPDLVRPNFGDRVGLPSVSLGGTNWNETKAQLEVVKTVEKELGRPVSTAFIYKVSQLEPPRDDTDGPPPMQQQAMLPQTMLPNPFGPTASTGPTPIGTNPVGSTPALPPASGTTAGTTAAPNSPKPTTGNVPNPEGNQAPVVVQGASELLNTVGGASAILELQKQYVAGAITRDMAIANATAIYGITRENVEALFPASVPIAKPVAEPTDAKGGSADQPAETFSEQEVTNFADVFVENENGDILLLLRRDDDTFQPSTWCLPGGKIDAGETPEQAALRELEEETGLDVGRVRPFRSYPTDNGGQSHVFVCKVHGKQDVKCSDEHTGYRWVGRDDGSKIDYMLDTKQRIDDYFATTGEAEQFAEASDKPEVKVAIAGPDGQAAIHLTERAMADGRALLASIARDAVERRLKEGGAGQGPLFNEDERELLAEAIASTNATAELLGRYRIREQVQSSDSTVRFAAFDAADSPLRVKPIPPEEALRFFRDLMPSLNLDPEFTDRHRRLSFTLAANTGEVILRAVHDAITEALANGTTGTYAVQSILDAAGVTPRNPQYADMVFRTNAIDAYNVGADDERQHEDVRDEFPAWQYLGINDGRQGADHAPHFGKYYPASATFNAVRGDRPFNCRCSQRAIGKREWERLVTGGAKFEDGF